MVRFYFSTSGRLEPLRAEVCPLLKEARGWMDDESDLPILTERKWMASEAV